MPLNPATLTEAILGITDPSREGHTFPADQAEAGQRWAAAARSYFAEMAFPPPNPAALAAGEAAMSGVLSAPGAGLAEFPGAWSGFAAAMIPVLAPVVAVPPPAPPAIPPLPAIADPNPPAMAIATAIDAWVRTGLGGIPPAPPTTPWS